LAPYANKKYAEKSYDIFSSTIQVDNLDFAYIEATNHYEDFAN
jgi:hypothetical protein